MSPKVLYNKKVQYLALQIEILCSNLRCTDSLTSDLYSSCRPSDRVRRVTTNDPRHAVSGLHHSNATRIFFCSAWSGKSLHMNTCESYSILEKSPVISTWYHHCTVCFHHVFLSERKWLQRVTCGLTGSSGSVWAERLLWTRAGSAGLCLLTLLTMNKKRI